MSAAASASDAAAKATYPAFRDEMVMTLLAVADSHPWAARSQELLAGPDPDNVATLPRCVCSIWVLNCYKNSYVGAKALLGPPQPGAADWARPQLCDTGYTSYVLPEEKHMRCNPRQTSLLPRMLVSQSWAISRLAGLAGPAMVPRCQDVASSGYQS